MVAFGVPLPIMLVWLFLFGAVVGSFLNVCIYRIPQKEGFGASLKGLLSPPSSCPSCFKRIPWYDNIPIVGWLKLRGRCRFCNNRISIRYPTIELFNGLLFAFVYWLEVPSEFRSTFADSILYNQEWVKSLPGTFWLSPVAVVHCRYLYHMVLFEALLVATFIDIDLRIIPDGVTLPAMLAGFVGAAIGQMYLVPLWFQSTSIMRSAKNVFPEWSHMFLDGPASPSWFAQYPMLHGLLASLAGFVVGGGSIWMIRLIGAYVLRQEAMGFGDVILMAMIGSFIGWQPTLIVFFLAPACAMVVHVIGWLIWRERELPYGPYLSLATLIVVLDFKHVWAVAERVFSMGPLLLPVALLMAGFLFVTLFAVQGIKKLLGIPLYPPDYCEEWTSADQLAHFSGETVDIHQGQWRPNSCDIWPGVNSGRGVAYNESWRRGT